MLASPVLGPLKTQKNSSYNRMAVDAIFTAGSSQRKVNRVYRNSQVQAYF